MNTLLNNFSTMARAKGSKNQGVGAKNSRGGRRRKKRTGDDDEEEQVARQDQERTQDQDQEGEERQDHQAEVVEDGGEDQREREDGLQQETPSKRTKKPRRPQGVHVPVLDEDQEEEALEWIRSHEELYNRRHRRWRETNHREGLWQEQANRLGISVDELKLWWDGLRNRYVHLTKPGKSGSGVVTGTARELWIVQNLSFLGKFIARHQGKTTVSLATLAPERPVPSPPALDTEAQDVGPESGVDSDGGPSRSRAAARPRKRRRRSDEDESEERANLQRRRDEAAELTSTIRELVQTQNDAKDDPQKALGNMFSSLIKQIDPRLYRSFYDASMEFIQDWQHRQWDLMESDKEQQQQEQEQQQQPAASFVPQQQQQQSFFQPPQQQSTFAPSPFCQPQTFHTLGPRPRSSSIFSMSSSASGSRMPGDYQAAPLYNPPSCNPATPSNQAIEAVTQGLRTINELNQ